MVRGSLGKGDLIPGGSAQPLGRRLGNPPPGRSLNSSFPLHLVNLVNVSVWIQRFRTFLQKLYLGKLEAQCFVKSQLYGIRRVNPWKEGSHF